MFLPTLRFFSADNNFKKLLMPKVKFFLLVTHTILKFAKILIFVEVIELGKSVSQNAPISATYFYQFFYIIINIQDMTDLS